MSQNSVLAALVAVGIIAGACIPATSAGAQEWRAKASSHRQKTKNNWRNAAIGSGALGALGLLSHNGTLAAAGAAGSIYSLTRYEHDRKSQSKIDRARAAHYARAHYYRNGHRYDRKVVTRNGHRYYQYVRS